jgi:hypothetical protein
VFEAVRVLSVQQAFASVTVVSHTPWGLSSTFGRSFYPLPKLVSDVVSV